MTHSNHQNANWHTCLECAHERGIVLRPDLLIRNLSLEIKPQGGMNRQEHLAYSAMLHAMSYLRGSDELKRFIFKPTAEFFAA